MTHSGNAVEVAPRSTKARVGVAALNLIQPGLGLLRVGAGRAATLLIALPFVWLLGVIVLFATAPSPNFAAIVIFFVATVALILTLYVTAIALTWRLSTSTVAPRPWWSRWYVLVAVVIITSVVANIVVEGTRRFYKPFYIPSEHMAPTLGKIDRIVADMRAGRRPAVGDIVLIRSGAVTYVKRVVGLPGDHVAMASDIPIINGVRARVREAGFSYFLGIHGQERARRFREQLPHEIGAHDIAIVEQTSYGDMAEQIVPAGHVFVLGDNRERSADSRLPIAESGLGMVSTNDLIGQPLYITWSQDRGQIGRPVSH